MRDIRVTDDIFTGPATDELLDDLFFMRWVDDDLEPRMPDAVDRFIERRIRAEAVAEVEAPAGLPSVA